MSWRPRCQYPACTHTHTHRHAHNVQTAQPSITLISNLGIRIYPTNCVKANLRPELIQECRLQITSFPSICLRWICERTADKKASAHAATLKASQPKEATVLSLHAKGAAAICGGNGKARGEMALNRRWGGRRPCERERETPPPCPPP